MRGDVLTNKGRNPSPCPSPYGRGDAVAAMQSVRQGGILCLAAVLTGVFVIGPADAADQSLKSATSFLSTELQRRQADETANPGMLWEAEGAELWNKPEGAAGKACTSCHGDAKTSMKGVAARYPAIGQDSGKLLNIELRINHCRTHHQSAQAFPYESEEMLALTAYIARQSAGMPLSVRTDGPAAPYFEKGRALYYMRQGQINLSCAQCHDENLGRHLRSDIISSAIPSGYPVYRLEWQTLGSLHRRLRACSLGVRAIQFPYGSDEYVSLELYLAKRAEGFALEAPAIRK
jgi:L-cysteine S-thiosulfotransferase